MADIGEFIKAECSTSSRYHLILAADVLPYVGDLKQIMTQATSLLEEDGLFGFTVETHAGAGIGLGEKLRYAHSEMRVRDAIASVGLALHILERASTRNEGGVPVANIVVLAGRL